MRNKYTYTITGHGAAAPGKVAHPQQGAFTVFVNAIRTYCTCIPFKNFKYSNTTRNCGPSLFPVKGRILPVSASTPQYLLAEHSSINQHVKAECSPKYLHPLLMLIRPGPPYGITNYELRMTILMTND